MTPRGVVLALLACAACARGDARDAGSATTRAPAASNDSIALTASAEDDREYVARVFQEAVGQVPRMGWLLPNGRFLAETTAAAVTPYAPARAPLPLAFVEAVTEEARRRLTARFGVLCEGNDSVAAYALANPPRQAERALFTVRPLPDLRAGIAAIAAPQPDHTVRAFGWPATDPMRLDTAVAMAGSRFWYSFHARYGPDSVLALTLLALHDSTGATVAAAVRDSTAYACADCETPRIGDGLPLLFNVLNLFTAAPFPYPLLLLDTGTFEGRAVSLVTFTPAGRRAELRAYEYTMTCAPGADEQGPR